ncbi:MAG: NAD(P)H-dependent oxidoreductase [Desulfocapsaceae bacterium]|nr:NAD(P)H-dependent oxidoreductase [Desulfocapsaceae bacterium]
MRCLVVTTHPLSKSLCKQLTEHVVNKLTSMKHEVVIEDLYAEEFDPVLTVAERESYYSTSYDSSKISEQVDRLQEAEALVLLFPTWWFSFPAMLKGWFDRVWGPGIAYDHASNLGAIKPRLDNLRKVLVVTTLGAPWWVDRLIMLQPVKRILKVALLGACAKKSTLKYLSLYNSEKLNEQSISRFKYKIDKAINDWGR